MKLWGSKAMKDEYLGFWSFLIFLWQETIFSHLIKLLLKNIWENQVLKLFLWALGTTSFLTTTTAVNFQQMSKIQSRRLVKPKITIKNHYQNAKIIQSICSIHQIICEMHLILESYMI